MGCLAACCEVLHFQQVIQASRFLFLRETCLYNEEADTKDVLLVAFTPGRWVAWPLKEYEAWGPNTNSDMPFASTDLEVWDSVCALEFKPFSPIKKNCCRLYSQIILPPDTGRFGGLINPGQLFRRTPGRTIRKRQHKSRVGGRLLRWVSAHKWNHVRTSGPMALTFV